MVQKTPPLGFNLGALLKYLPEWTFFFKKTQVGSPAVRFRLARCTAWVKRWSEAMDFFQTIFKTFIFLPHILEICTKNQKLCKKHQKFTKNMTLCS